MMNGITRKPAFWIAFALISALSGVFAWRFFPQALPLINLDVKMTRDDAIDRAIALSAKLDLAPADARRAVLFTHDGTTQNFVELEAGGKPRFAELLSGRHLTRRTGGKFACSSPTRPPRRAYASGPMARPMDFS